MNASETAEVQAALKAQKRHDDTADAAAAAATVTQLTAEQSQVSLLSVRERERVELVGSHGRWKRPCLSNSPHDHMMLRVELVGSHGRWKRPCLQTAHMTI
jgi:hypothetical protein